MPRFGAMAAPGLLLVSNYLPPNKLHITTMEFTVSIPQYLVPGIVATAALESIRLNADVTAQLVVQNVAIEMANRVCQDLKVGPYYVGPTLPQFNADGTPYSS
jgi:hypothetical protein